MLNDPSETMELTVFDRTDRARVARVLSSAAYEGLAVVHGDSVIAFNSQFADMCGTSVDAADEQPLQLADCFDGEALEQIQAVIAREEMTYRDFVLYEIDDDEWLEIRFRAITDDLPAGHVVLVVRDVTDQIRAHQELGRAKADLEQFAYVASHDLKSPLRGISNLAAWIRDDLEEQLTGQTEEYFRLLEGRIQRMETLLEDLLAYSRAGRDQASTADIWVDEFVEDLVDFVAPPQGFEVEIQCDHFRVNTTPTPLRTVIQNLVQNVFKHHDGDQGHLLIAVALDEANQELLVEVEDDGPGIPQRFHEKIFAVFETLRPRDEVEGSGIGLALVRRLTEDAGGVIEIQSPIRDERGSCFRLSWPVLQPESPE